MIPIPLSVLMSIGIVIALLLMGQPKLARDFFFVFLIMWGLFFGLLYL